MTNPLTELNLNDGDLRRLAQDRNKVVIVGMLSRPGVRPWFTALEHRLFPPTTPANAQFEFMLLRWPGPNRGVPEPPYPSDAYALLVIPRLALGGAERIATEFEIRIVPAMPHVVTWRDRPNTLAIISTQFPERIRKEQPTAKVLPFPIPPAPNVRSIENLALSGPMDEPEIRKRDSYLCEVEMERWAQRMGIPFDADATKDLTLSRAAEVYDRLHREGSRS